MSLALPLPSVTSNGVYFAGPMENVSELKASLWRDLAAEYLRAMLPHMKVLCLDPTKHKRQPGDAPAETFWRDMMLISKSQVMLVNLCQHNTVIANGTAMEVMWMSQHHKKPVVAWYGNEEVRDKAINHPFFNVCVTHHIIGLREACLQVAATLSQLTGDTHK
jgi:nucleoside 2-deoxyribosyltransferase